MEKFSGYVMIRMRMIFNNPCASLCGQTFDTPLPLSLFLSAERSGRLKIIRVLYRLCFRRSPVYRDIHRKRCRSCAWFSLPLWGIMKAKNFRRICLCRQSSLQELLNGTGIWIRAQPTISDSHCPTKRPYGWKGSSSIIRSSIILKKTFQPSNGWKRLGGGASEIGSYLREI